MYLIVFSSKSVVRAIQNERFSFQTWQDGGTDTIEWIAGRTSKIQANEQKLTRSIGKQKIFSI